MTDIRDLAPPHLAALKDLNELEKETGISGDVNVTIKAPDPTSPAVISWAEGFQQRVLARHGFSGSNPSCADAQICPALSLTDFFGGSSGGVVQLGLDQWRLEPGRRATFMPSSRHFPASSRRS